ncbi:hypothetical protein QTP70_009190 [Hemibagrus guttatus]|uniref:Reverse transcriptase domain-containing protein n=1 Tax=Hemibagrus guttatus TaxID=175788 RepID=A0AAE0VAT3_9TELE|nr:hypothetical protein QTP70_009190 [Hemibagrus guttatus]
MTVTSLHISDHHLVSFSITLPVLPKCNSQHLSLTRRNLHSISPSSVASCTLSSLPDHESFSSLPLDSATDTLLSSLSSNMDLLCPLSTIRRKNSSPAPWLSDVLRNNRRELRSAARKWKKSKLDTDLISYRTLLSKFSLDVTSAKTSFYKEKLETSAQDPRKLHNIFSSLLNPPAPPSPSFLTAEDFANFYTEKIERICQTFTSLPTSPTSHTQHSATPSLTQLSTVASEEVLQITRSCNPTTCPLNPIPSAMLQTISPDLLPFITTVINGSLTSGHVPTAFKKARVIPILKKPALDPSDISNYRPVSLLSFISNILERVVCIQLSDYLMQNNHHDPNQSGFKAAHSTETSLLTVTEKLHAARSAKLSSVLILLDLSAAFASYLDGRSYQITWKGLTSAPCRLSTGVPQSSVLGPLLFSRYTHSLGKVISSHGFSYHCYADDTQLIFSFPPSDTTASAWASVCLADISSWMTAHQLKLNPSKTELLIIPGDPSPAQDLAISLSNSMISPTASARNLGVTMANQLSFSSHVTNVTCTCRFLLYNIRRIRPFLSTQATQRNTKYYNDQDGETWLHGGVPDNAIELAGRHTLRADRSAYDSDPILFTTEHLIQKTKLKKESSAQLLDFYFQYKRHLSTTSNSQTPNSTMAKTKELSRDTRNKIVDLHQAGKTESAIDTTASARISACLSDISSWMTAHQLKLNPSKTELLIIPGDPSPAEDLTISLSNSMISPLAIARNLGVMDELGQILDKGNPRIIPKLKTCWENFYSKAQFYGVYKKVLKPPMTLDGVKHSIAMMKALPEMFPSPVAPTKKIGQAIEAHP